MPKTTVTPRRLRRLPIIVPFVVAATTLAVPPPAAVAADLANLRFTKTVDRAAVQAYDRLHYTLTVSNDGPAAAEDTLVEDHLPSGLQLVSADAPCTSSGDNVRCELGTLPAGESRTVVVTAKVRPAVTPSAEAGVEHDIDVQKVESQLDLDALQTRTVSVQCAPGHVVTDGSGRVDAVDQGTGTLASVRFLQSYASDSRTWTVTALNLALGRAQAKVYAVCVRTATGAAGADAGHTHDLVESAVLTGSLPLPLGRSDLTLSCASGSVPVVPGYRLSGVVPGTALPTSYPLAGDGWSFGVEGPSAGGLAASSLRCLQTRTSSADGHEHGLELTEVRRTVNVPSGQVVEEQLSCADDAKAIVAGYQLRAGLVSLGSDPRPKIRAFKLYNPSGTPLQADLYVRCLAVRTHSELAGTDLSVINTASASTTTPETSYDDNTDTAGVTFDPINMHRPAVATPASGAVRVAARSVTTSVRCSSGGSTCAGTATLVALRTQKAGGRTVRKGTVLARTTFRVGSGTVGTVRLVPTAAGARALKARSVRQATLRVGSASRVVTVRR